MSNNQSRYVPYYHESSWQGTKLCEWLVVDTAPKCLELVDEDDIERFGGDIVLTAIGTEADAKQLAAELNAAGEGSETLAGAIERRIVREIYASVPGGFLAIEGGE
jgi:hypothetical protein